MSDTYLVNEDGEILSSGSTDAPVLFGFYTPHDRVIVDCGGELITKQEFKDECDINTILYQFTTTGIINHINTIPAVYGDLPDMSDFQTSLAIISEAEAAFSALPSKVRDRYQNDPAVFLGALADPSQKDFLTEVGIFKDRAVPVEGLSRPGDAPASRTPAAGGGAPADAPVVM